MGCCSSPCLSVTVAGKQAGDQLFWGANLQNGCTSHRLQPLQSIPSSSKATERVCATHGFQSQNIIMGVCPYSWILMCVCLCGMGWIAWVQMRRSIVQCSIHSRLQQFLHFFTDKMSLYQQKDKHTHTRTQARTQTHTRFTVLNNFVVKTLLAFL